MLHNEARKLLIPALSSDSIVVMDNMRSHHTRAVKDLLAQAGVQYLYLPPYSPDLDPIEKMWSIARLEISTTETAYLRFSEDEPFEDTTRGRARRIMAEYQKSANTN